MDRYCELVKQNSPHGAGVLARVGHEDAQWRPFGGWPRSGIWRTLRAVAAKRAKAPKAKVRKKKSSLFCYTKDLTEALGVTRRTLYKYVQDRLLPAPILYSDGRNGVRSRWTMVAMDHVDFINEQKALGYNLVEITAMIAARWGTHDKMPAKDTVQKSPKPPGPGSPNGEGSAA